MTQTRGPLGRGQRERRVRQNFVATIRQRPVERKIEVIDTDTDTTRTTLITPSAGKRIRVHQIKVVQLTADGTHESEFYFGTADNIAAAGEKAIDLVRVTDTSQATTRTWDDALSPKGPLGARDEVLSHRWIVAATNAHKVVVQYSEES